MKIKKGDTVKILKGKDVGKQGKVLKVVESDKKIIVEGVNVYKKHIKGDGRDKESAIVDIVKPISISNVMLVCSSCGKTTKVGIKIDDGKKIRVCKKCKKVLDGGNSSSKKEDKVSKNIGKKKVNKKK